MKVIIVGMGRVGTTLTQELCREGHDLVVVENNAATLQECVDKFDIQGVCGKGCSADILREAGVENCDMLVSVMPEDENNILCCIVAKALGARNLVARVRDPVYYKQFEFLRSRIGIGMLVNPEEAAAHEIMCILRFPAATKINSFSEEKVDIVEFKLPKDSKIEGMTLAEIRKKLKIDALIVTIEREGNIIVPNGDVALKSGDVVGVCAKHYEVSAFFRTFGLFRQKADSVMILGGGDDVFYLARELEESGFFVKVICNSYERCLAIKGGLKKAVVVCGDYTDREVLEREGIANADAVVSMSHYDENNIVTSLFAQTKGVEKPVAVLRGDSYRGLLESVGIDTAISPYRLAAEKIVRYLRATDVEEGSAVKAMYKLADERAEGLLFNINGNAQFSGKSLKDLPLRNGVLIAAVVRGKNVFIPDGNFTLEGKDDVVIISSGKRIFALEDILTA